MDDFKDKIIAIRTQERLNQKRFAEELNVSPSYISQIESGARTPSKTVLALIYEKYAINPEWWESGVGPMSRKDRSTSCDNVVDLGSITEAIELKRRGVLSTLPEDIRESVALESQQELVRKIAALETELATRKQIEAALVNDNQKKALVIENLINGELLAEEPKEQQPVVKKLQKNSITSSSKKVSKSL